MVAAGQLIFRESLTVDASVTGTAFYTARGYLRTSVDREGTAGIQIGMEKQLEL
jgi:hypothetical protein